MTQREWEKKLLKELKQLPKEEKDKILEYYREIYGDKLDAGFSADAIMKEFGDPRECAHRILAEEYADRSDTAITPPPRTHGISAPYVIGLFFLTVLLILPLAIAALGVIVTFAVISIGGFAVSLSGIIVIVWCFFQFPIGAVLVAALGAGITFIGVGCLLLVCFYMLTKYTAIGTFEALKWIYVRKKGA